jgi:purine-binding chemotaxis protein CheW
MPSQLKIDSRPVEISIEQISGSQQFLTFTIGDDEYGVDIMNVREVKGWTDITRLPNTPSYVRGVLNLRGIIIPIFDLRTRFCGTHTEATPKHVVIVLALQDRTIGILVDAVSDILTIASGEIKTAPETGAEKSQRFISGLISAEGRMVVLLSLEELLQADIDALTEPIA